jgi:catecholate siderophore receptor
MWMPVATIDVGVHRRQRRPGHRPSLTPAHSGTVWTTYQITPQLRVGGGLNCAVADADPQPGWEAPGFVTADLMAEYAINDR